MSAARRRAEGGFTLIELMAVIAIIGLLVGLLLAAVNAVRFRQKAAATRQAMGGITLAIDHYIERHAILGDLQDATSSDFVARPMEFLLARGTRSRNPTYLDPPPRSLSTAAGLRADRATAELLLDEFGHPYRWEIANRRTGAAGPHDFTDKVVIASSLGAPGGPDKLTVTYRHDTGDWVWSER